MSSVEVNGKQLATDEEGYLENLSDWEPDVMKLPRQYGF